MAPVRPNPVWISFRHQEDPLARADLGGFPEEAFGWHQNTRLALNRLEQKCAGVSA